MTALSLMHIIKHLIVSRRQCTRIRITRQSAAEKLLAIVIASRRVWSFLCVSYSELFSVEGDVLYRDVVRGVGGEQERFIIGLFRRFFVSGIGTRLVLVFKTKNACK